MYTCLEPGQFAGDAQIKNDQPSIFGGRLEQDDNKARWIAGRIQECGLPPRRYPDHVARRFAYSLVLARLQVDVSDRDQQLRAWFVRRWKWITGEQLNVSHSGGSQPKRVHELGMRINRRTNRSGSIFPRAGIGLIAVVGHFRVKKFDCDIAIFGGAVVTHAKRASTRIETDVALTKVK